MTGNIGLKKFNIHSFYSAVFFYTFRGFLHKLYAATVDGKGREGTHNFFSYDDWVGSRKQSIGHRGDRGSCPCHPAGAAHAVQFAILTIRTVQTAFRSQEPV